MKIKGLFKSVWDFGNSTIITPAELDTETGDLTVEIYHCETTELFYLDEEIFIDEDKNEYEVCPECHNFIMREKMFEGEGNGIDYDGQKICSNPYCESNWV